jgi:hypothetical protein
MARTEYAGLEETSRDPDQRWKKLVRDVLGLTVQVVEDPAFHLNASWTDPLGTHGPDAEREQRVNGSGTRTAKSKGGQGSTTSALPGCRSLRLLYSNFDGDWPETSSCFPGSTMPRQCTSTRELALLRTINGNGISPSPRFAHPALRVQLNARWLALLPFRPVGNRLYRVSGSHIRSASARHARWRSVAKFLTSRKLRSGGEGRDLRESPIVQQAVAKSP